MACVAVIIGSQEGRGTVMTFLLRLDDMLVHIMALALLPPQHGLGKHLDAASDWA